MLSIRLIQAEIPNLENRNKEKINKNSSIALVFNELGQLIEEIFFVLLNSFTLPPHLF